MGESLLLIGNGGHCKSILDSLFDSDLYDKIGLISEDYCDSDLYGIPCVGKDEDLDKLFKNGWKKAFISLGSIGDSNKRKKLFELIKSIGFDIPVIIDKSACVSDRSCIKEGTYIGKNAIVNIGTTIGVNSIINSSSVIEHDCVIGDHCHISSNSTICGGCKIGNETHIGAGSVIRQGLEIGNNTTIGIGSVVTKNIIGDNIIAYGVPCKVVRKK